MWRFGSVGDADNGKETETRGFAFVSKLASILLLFPPGPNPGHCKWCAVLRVAQISQSPLVIYFTVEDSIGEPVLVLSLIRAPKIKEWQVYLPLAACRLRRPEASSRMARLWVVDGSLVQGPCSRKRAMTPNPLDS